MESDSGGEGMNGLIAHHTKMGDYSEGNASMKSMSTQGLEDLAPQPRLIPIFAQHEITKGRLVGKGGFSTVHEVKFIELDDMHDISDELTILRKDFVTNLKQRPPGSTVASLEKDSSRYGGGSYSSSTKYVLKTLRNDLPEIDHVKGVIDLAIEAEFLSSLWHTNIITMRGTANTDPQVGNYFVLLDRLMYTLEKKFNIWRTVILNNSGYWLGPLFGYCCSKTQHLFTTWVQRMEVLLALTNAIQYLHSHKIVYRDLKPDNIGFDNTDELKVFDFGLAKNYDSPNIDRAENGLYHLTGNTGSLRYMAPEVALGLPYNHTVDTFSFGILFWQVCTLTTPFAGFSTKIHAKRVVRGNHRPKTDPTWPLAWVNLMDDCWSSDIFRRPSFDYISSIIQQQVDDLYNDYGILPTRTTEIRAAKRRIQCNDTTAEGSGGNSSNQKNTSQLDIDTRISSLPPSSSVVVAVEENEYDATTIKRFDEDIV